WKTGATGTHRNSYPGGKYAYLSAAAPGFSSNILVILDISDPAQPKEAGRWWMTGQREGETKPEGPEGFHGPANISPDGKVASMAYSPAAVNLGIRDVTKPKLIGPYKNFCEKGGRFGPHNVNQETPLPAWRSPAI